MYIDQGRFPVNASKNRRGEYIYAQSGYFLKAGITGANAAKTYISSMNDLEKIRSLVGDITTEHLIYVDYAVSDSIGVFMPVAGQCGYAIQPRHTHPAWSFIVSFDNLCSTDIGGTIIESVPSTVRVMPPLLPHQELPSSSVARYIAVMITPEYLAAQCAAYGITPCSFTSAMICPSSRRLVDALKEFMAEYEEAAPGYEQILTACGLKITHLLIRLLLNIRHPPGTTLRRMSVTRAIEYCNEHYGEKISVNDLAVIANCSVSHFSRIFKEETRLSPTDYLLQLRLDYAKRMLRADERSITEIALVCGFGSSSYFAQCFTRAFQLSPSDFRKSFQ